MYLLYIDESGDPGLEAGSSPIFLMSGVLVRGRDWEPLNQRYRAFRRNLKSNFGLPFYVELHGQDLVGSRGRVGGMRMKLKHRRSIFRSCLNFMTSAPELQVCSVFFDKEHPKFREPADGVHGGAALFLYQRMSNFLGKRNDLIEKRLQQLAEEVKEGAVPERAADAMRNVLRALPRHQRGLIFADETNAPVMRRILRRMRAYNPIPSGYGPGYRDIPDQWIVEDPSFRDSRLSPLVQLADWAATALKCQERPTGYQERTGLHESYELLRPVLLTKASRFDPRKQGTVRYPR